MWHLPRISANISEMDGDCRIGTPKCSDAKWQLLPQRLKSCRKVALLAALDTGYLVKSLVKVSNHFKTKSRSISARVQEI